MRAGNCTCFHTYIYIYIYIYRDEWWYKKILCGWQYCFSSYNVWAETLLHSLERAAAGIGLYVNAHKTEYMCYNQTGDISTLDGTPLKLVDKFTYLGRGCPRGVMVKAMNYGIVVREFVLQSRYYVHFRANTLGKGMNPLILPPAMGK